MSHRIRPALTRREWCRDLAKLVSPSFPVEAQAALVDMLPALSHLPDDVFTVDTIKAVAWAKRRQSVPAWDEIIKALNDYQARFPRDPTYRLSAKPNADIPQGRLPPGPEEVAMVTEMLTSWREEVVQSAIQRELDRPKGHASRPLRDVTAKGDQLRDLRLARGCRVFPAMAEGD